MNDRGPYPFEGADICPFCGEYAAIDPSGTYSCKVECNACGAEGPPAGTPFMAVRLWNERYPKEAEDKAA